jgi:hypothetical protein
MHFEIISERSDSEFDIFKGKDQGAANSDSQTEILHFYFGYSFTRGLETTTPGVLRIPIRSSLIPVKSFGNLFTRGLETTIPGSTSNSNSQFAKFR